MEEIVTSNLSKEKKAELAHGIVTQLKNLIFEQGMTFLEIGRHLKILRDEQLWETLNYESFNAFLSTADIGLKQSTAYSFILLYEIYILKLHYTQEEIAPIPYYKLKLLGSKIKPKTKEEADDWLERAKTLGANDFDISIREFKGNEGHEHPIPFPHIYRCKECKKWKIVTDKQYVCQCP